MIGDLGRSYGKGYIRVYDNSRAENKMLTSGHLRY